ncbi:MAG: universal stress protein [Candidatus Binatus sp.]|uniref:universal stress protein n=2 Tax=Candidatus Binatus sp. TaxID=2811406 RepID=UPI003BC5D7D8
MVEWRTRISTSRLSELNDACGEIKMMAIERILVPIDFPESSLKALDDAVEFSRPYEAELILLFVVERGFYESPLLVPDSGALLEHQARATEEKLEEMCRSLGKQGVKCRTLIEFGVAYQAIIDAANKVHANLIVISTHGRTGLAHVLIGSVAERVVQHAVCPVLVIHTLPKPKRPVGTRSR